MKRSSASLEPTALADVLVRFLRAETGKFGFSRGVLGVSGGLDSAVAATLAARALGPRNVLGLLLPYRTSSAASERLGLALCESLKIKHERIDITGMVDGYLDAAGLSIAKRAHRLRCGNVMARARMIAIFDRSARDGSLVIGTSDKTETLLGYTTWFGDSASAINPLGDLYKTQVLALGREIGVPAEILERPATPDLWPGQTAEGEMGVRYGEVDAVLGDLVDRRLDEKELFERGHSPKLVRWIVGRIKGSHYKRRPPIVAKVSPRTMNLDFRYLRDWGR